MDISIRLESDNAFGETESFHTYMRNMFEIVNLDHDRLKTEVILIFAMKTYNDAAGPSEMVPTLLVVAFVLRVLVRLKEIPNQHQRVGALHKAREKISLFITKL